MNWNAERQMPNDELTDLEPRESSEQVSGAKGGENTDVAALQESPIDNLQSEIPGPQSLTPESSTPDSPLPTPDSAIPSPPPLDPNQVIEALLFAADAPVKLDRLAELAEVPPETVRAVIDRLNANYQETGRTFRVQRVAQGFQLYTMPDYAEFVRRLYQHQYTHRLSHAALEVLAIVAYKQPVTRPEVEQLRGVDCSGPLVTLLERRLIATYGRASRPGNPFLYRTTPEFLRYFGLAGLEDLPRMEEIGEFLARRETGTDGSEPEKGETLAAAAPVDQFDSLAMDGGHRDAAPEDAR
jgi:segregation and condensation protein B